jgi:hypothetical protein
MKIKTLLGGLAALSLAGAAVAQSTPAAPEVSADAFRGHVAFLADDLLEGREAGSRGYDIGARYVATQFETLGLRPGGPDGAWQQPIEFLRYRLRGTPTLTVAGQTFEHRRDLIMRPNPEPAPFTIEAPMVFAGYGIALGGQDDYAGLDVSGKIVVVFDGYPQGMPSDVGAHLAYDKARVAASHGAAGMIILRTPEQMRRRPWARMVSSANRPGTTWLGPDGQPFAGAGLGFSAIVERPVADAIFLRAPQALDTILRRIAADGSYRPPGFALGPTARVRREGTSERFRSANVLAVLPGTDPALANDYVLLMAHLDGLGVRGDGQGDRIRNGAMDNATGVATLIEVARAMSRPGNRPRRPILFAAVTAEEIGLLGAEYLASNVPVEGRVVSVVNLDMPILTYDFQDVIAFGAEHSTMGPIVERAAARMGVRLIPDPLPEQGLFTRSDHYKFVRAGVPSVFLMTGFGGEGRQRFTSFLEHEYHSPEDDLRQPFNWQAGARFAQLNYLIAREIADGPEAPQWYADSVFGGERPRAARPASGGAR